MKKARILFAEIPDSPDLTFVEVENEEGYGINFGKWVQDGEYRVLEITKEDFDREGK